MTRCGFQPYDTLHMELDTPNDLILRYDSESHYLESKRHPYTGLDMPHMHPIPLFYPFISRRHRCPILSLYSTTFHIPLTIQSIHPFVFYT